MSGCASWMQLLSVVKGRLPMEACLFLQSLVLDHYNLGVTSITVKMQPPGSFTF